MKKSYEKRHNRKNKAACYDEEAPTISALREVRQYEKGRVKKGARFGKKWFPENKSD